MLEFKNEKNLDNEIKKLKKITNIISAISILLALNLIVWGICFFLFDYQLGYGIAFIVSFIIYVVYLFTTYRFYKALSHKNNVKLVYKNHKLRRNNEYSKFFDTGSDLIDKNDYKESDLDLFGKNSLYQYLSICKTKHGRLKLKDALTKPRDFDMEYTNAINEFANSEKTIELEARLLEFKNEAKTLDYDIMYQTFGNKIKFKILFLLPLLSFIGMIVYFILIFTNNLNPYFILIFLGLNFFLAKFALRNEVFSISSTKYYNLLDTYYYVSKELSTIESDNKYINEFKNESINSMSSIKGLKGLLNLLSTRSNILFNILSNAFLIFDLIVILIFNRRAKNIDSLRKYFDLIGDMECMMSLANIGIDNVNYCMPILGEVKINEMYHPLVPKCVSNSFDLSGGVILTGSNMSGKTTFMRTLGVCQTLFNAKGLIPAIEYQSKNLNIYTSLRANDMLSEGISTFYAEILRMKNINQKIKEEDTLVLIDEIFKGTNANDRLTASFKVIEKLNDAKSLFIISTHDFELCEAKNILNYHFNEEYSDENKIMFDYKIKPGKCETKNAIYLLKMADII